MTPNLDAATLAEQAVLGAFMLDAGARQRVNGLAREHFSTEQHRAIFTAILDSIEDGGTADVVSVYAKLRDADKADHAGGLAYLNSLATNTPSAANVGTYAALVEKHARRRKGLSAAQNLAEALASGDEDAARRHLAHVVKLADKAETPPADLPRVLDLAALAKTEPQPPRFIVEGWLPEGEATLFAGHGGSGKSLVGLTLAVCVAAGRNFYGLRCERRRVLFLSMEDGAEVLHWRLSRVCTMLGVDLAALAGWLFAFDAKADGEPLFIELRDGATPTAALQWLAGEVTRTQAEVLLLDNTSDAYAANENARAQVKAFVRQVLRIVPANGAVMLLHHLDAASAHGGSSKGYSGSTGWHNSCRARWFLKPADDGEDADPARVVLELRKSNHGKPGAVLPLRFSEPAGCFVSDGVLPATPLDRKLRESDERAAVLELIRAAEAAGDPLPAATAGTRTAYSAACVRPDCPESLKSRAGRERFLRHVETLRQAGSIRLGDGRKANGHVREVLRASK